MALGDPSRAYGKLTFLEQRLESLFLLTVASWGLS